jgi:hypothetical protein
VVGIALSVALSAAVPTSGHAASGLFVWTDNATGLVTPIPFPADEKCFDTFGANRAQNLTGSDAVLAKDGLCSDVLTVIRPGGSYDGGFGSVGFTPPGATKGVIGAHFSPTPMAG